jgi:hypothetical protein
VRDNLTDLGLLLSGLLLLSWSVLVALQGILVLDDTTRVYVAIALFFASVVATVCLAQLLGLGLNERAESR